MAFLWLTLWITLAQAAPPVGPAPAEAPPGQPAAAQTADDATDAQAPAGENDGQPDKAPGVDPDEASGSILQFFYNQGGALLNSGALGLLFKGGLFMWPILILAVLALGVIIERYRSLKMLNTDSQQLRDDVLQMLQNDQIEQALQRCNTEQGPVPAVLGAGLRKFYVLRRLGYDPARIEEQVVKSMEDYGVHIVAALERHLPILATIASVAPMIGFLGTVSGMIVSFQNIVEKMGEQNIVEAAASGIEVALLTTCFGLIVGIPAYMAFNYFTGVINRFVLEVEESSAELIEAVTLRMTLQAQADPAAQPAPAPTA